MEYVYENQLLNDDCILEIFDYLSVKDLCSVAQVSQQFKKLAQITFRNKYRKIKLSDHFTSVGKKQLGAFFINFGRYIEHLDISSRIFKFDWTCLTIQTYTIWLIKQNCVGGNNLKSLKMEHFSGIGRNFQSMDKILANLEVLTLRNVALPYSVSQLLCKLPKIRELTVDGCCIKSPIIQYNMTSFNPNLQILRLKCTEEFNTSDVLTYIDVHFPNLVEFVFNLHQYNLINHDNYAEGLINLAKIKSLKKIDINFELHPAKDFMEMLVRNNVQIEHMNIRYCRFNSETINNLCKLHTIRKLGLTRTLGLTGEHLLQLSEQLPYLEIFSAWTQELNISTITEIVYNAKYLLKAEFELSREQIFTPQSFGRLINIIRAQKKKEPFQLLIHNFFGKSTNMLEKELIQNTTYDNLIQIQRYHTFYSSLLFD